MMIKHFLLSLATVGGLAHAAPPLQQFFEPAHFKDAAISPSGRYVALRIGDNTLRDGMVVIDSETQAVVGGTRLAGYDIAAIRWVNDNRLVYNVDDSKLTAGETEFAPGLWAVNRDGTDKRQLAEHRIAYVIGSLITRHVEPWNTFLMSERGAQDSEFIYARRPEWKERSHVIERTDLIRLNTSTGQATTVSRPAAAKYWMLDHKGEPSIMVSLKDGKQTFHYRDPASREWRVLATFTAYGEEDGIEPVGFVNDEQMLVKARLKGDKAALHTLDLSSGKVDPEPLVSLSDYDFSGSMVYSNKHLLGIHYLGEARSSIWFDAGMKAAQAEVDKRLPDLVNIITPPATPEVPWLLVRSYSDRQPHTYLLFNSKTGQLKVIGASHPDINPAEMGRQELVKVKARDGMQIPVWLTKPAKGGSKLPMVVMVHGGPYVRGTEWGWDSDAQFLASRGYAVLEPEYRGSTGYGVKLFSAGFKQWGLKMQDDIADSVKWAVEKGIADPDRVCIMGGSYGGYATLMGLVNDPELYRCGISYLAVTDIPLLYDGGMALLSDLPDDYKKHGVPVLVGDLEKDAAQLVATSPLKQAARIKRPLLMAHGSDDRRVPFVHFKKMRSALEDAKADAEFVEYVGEQHGWHTLKTRLDFWGRVEKFLDKHIGAGAKTE
ncbi:alpha/beta hydrolase family protein [Pseudoduganella sp. R-43]|uniref:alpha/beta hydrolase family protein n=1 Tax=Pseudoduganella sp. R-43 TaxID=3404063 RepID=UPI003CF41DDD